MKKLLSLLLAIVMLMGLSVGVSAATVTAKVTFTYSQENSIDFQPKVISVKNGTAYKYGFGEEATTNPTVLDAIVQAHVTKYGSKVFTKDTASEYMNAGLSKVFGKEGWAGHVVNGKMCMTLAKDTVITAGDTVDVFLYDSSFTDHYTAFYLDGKIVRDYACYLNDSVTFTVKGFPLNANGETWNPMNGLKVGIMDKEGNFTELKATNEKGEITLSFDKPGTYFITTQGTCGTTPVVPAWCTIKVTPLPETVMNNIAAKYAESGVASDKNAPWFAVDMAAYLKTFPETENKLSAEQKQAMVDVAALNLETATKGGDIAKYALALVAMGYDPANITTRHEESLNAIAKLVDGINAGTSDALTNTYTTPYAIILLQQFGDTYKAEIEKLIAVAVEKQSWLNTTYGPDGATPMILALAPYYSTNAEIKNLVDTAVEAVKATQKENGSLNDSAASTALGIIAFAALGIEPETVIHEKFGKDLVDGLMVYASENSDGFTPITNTASTEQGLRGLIAAHNVKAGIPYYLFDFSGQALVPTKATSEPINVSFRLIGDTKHEDGVDGHDEYVNWIKTVTYEMPAGSTVQDLLDRAVADYKLEYKVKEGTKDYVYAVKAPGVLGNYWLEEKMNGDLSGWMYKLNGEDSQSSISEQKLADEDEVVFHYSDDLMKENREKDSPYLNRWLEAEDITPEEYVAKQNQKAADAAETLISAIGTVTEDSKAAIDAARAAYDALTEAQKALVENYNDLTAAESAYAELTKVVVLDPSKLPFTDVEDDIWYAKAVAYVYSYGLMQGTGDGTTFSPDVNLNRAMMATILYRIEGSPKVTAENPFTDVPDGTWYTDAVIWAAENDVVKGVGDGTKFAPTDDIDRQQMAVMMYRYAKYKGQDMSASDSLSAFPDAAKVSSWADKEMKWAVAEGLISGAVIDGVTCLDPQGKASRAQAATVLMRFYENMD